MTPPATGSDARSGSVVVPAYNEAQRIPPLLPVLSEVAIEHGVAVVIACNGCRDDTAELARATPGVEVLEYAWASKPRALNEADRHLGGNFPRLYVDADVRTTAADLLRLLGALDEDAPKAVRPLARYDETGAPWPVRDHYRCRELIPSARWWHQHHIEGHHIYGTNRAGRAKFEIFPEEGQIMEDAFFDRMFDPSERAAVLDAAVLVPLPQTVRELMRAQVRVYQGNWQLKAWLAANRPDRLWAQAGMPKPAARGVAYLRYLLRGGSTFPSWRPGDVKAVVTTLAINAIAMSRARHTERRGRQSPWR